LEGFKPDDEVLTQDPDFSQKIQELEKLKATELKKNERGNKQAK